MPADVLEEQFEPSLKHLTARTYWKIPKEQCKLLQGLVRPHVESFNFMLTDGIRAAVANLDEVEFGLPNSGPQPKRILLKIQSVSFGVPSIVSSDRQLDGSRLYPSECRQRRITYSAPLQAKLFCSIDDEPLSIIDKVVGYVPVMVKSSICNLNRMTPTQLVVHGEEAQEVGGYFIINGNEKIIRMLTIPRRNFPIAMTRNSWKNRGKLFTTFGVQIRCVREDQSAANMVLHYLNDGSAQMMISFNKQLFFIPVIMLIKALVDETDFGIFSEITKGLEDDMFFADCIKTMLRTLQSEGLYSKLQASTYIGKKFRSLLYLPPWYTEAQCCEFLLRKSVCIHLDDNTEKFRLVGFMIRKLFSLVRGRSSQENPDNIQNHECLLSGHLYLLAIKEQLDYLLRTIRMQIELAAKAKATGYKLNYDALLKMVRTHALTRGMEYMLATGNLNTRSNWALMQTTGMAIMADKLNFWRFLSHFRSVHRGAFFATMRTTQPRKLLPESWGFLCPVHTPDGAPCGLLNHMTATCEVIAASDRHNLAAVLGALGVYPSGIQPPCTFKNCYTVFLDGAVFGWLPKKRGTAVADSLRAMKVLEPEKVPSSTEIVLVESHGENSSFPTLYIFTTSARMMRPVRNLTCGGQIEYIGTMEQVYMGICVIGEEAIDGDTTHQELSESSILSDLAMQIPFSDFNQSPRNMYQCQMGKQTMAMPVHSLRFRTDNKLYWLQTPQSPLVRPVFYDKLQMDNYPVGTNAIVAVISYTGYDMEDAMVLNKSSVERGFAHATVFKCDTIDLWKGTRERALVFGKSLKDHPPGSDKLDPDGLPAVGMFLNFGDPYYSTLNTFTGEMRVEKYKSSEGAYVDAVRLLTAELGSEPCHKVAITLRVPRNPTIGDKLSSRHGQKGVCSFLWPTESMPFSESGIVPDIIFNPHGIPSRMTVGKLLEVMAGKSAAAHGLVHDATPFRFSEESTAVDYFGRMLESAGFDYYGTETMYSGTDGRQLDAEIFMGIVYYQRLRHMVADKYQVRSTGAVDCLTHQPVKGRKKGGGVRFGEMERDSLLAHGAAYLLHDRLFNCSDRSIEHICAECGSLLSSVFESHPGSYSQYSPKQWTCKVCKKPDNVHLIAIPYVFKYLVAELASINIKVNIRVSDR